MAASAYDVISKEVENSHFRQTCIKTNVDKVVDL